MPADHIEAPERTQTSQTGAENSTHAAPKLHLIKCNGKRISGWPGKSRPRLVTDIAAECDRLLRDYEASWRASHISIRDYLLWHPEALADLEDFYPELEGMGVIERLGSRWFVPHPAFWGG